MINTPPTYSWYIAGLTFKWLKKIGGVKEMEKRNREKAEILYKQLDNSKHFENRVERKYRSLMNVPFFISEEAIEKDADLEKKFLAQATKKGLLTLAGHRSVGGMRASIYNAMPKEGVQALADFIAEFDETIKV
jgi:phosphoserine aminotransferase apoenzyme (EC 2.6.1.52)